MKINNSLRFQAKIYRFLLAFYNPRVYKPLFVCCFLVSLIACTKEEEKDAFTDTPAAAPQIQSNEVKSDAPVSGISSVTFEIESAVTSIQLVAHSADAELKIVKLSDSNGNVLFNANGLSDRDLTEASNFQASPLTFNYPSLSTQDTLRSGIYTAQYETRDPQTQDPKDSEVSLDLITKNDSDLIKGTINLNVILGDLAANNKEMRDGIESAVKLASVMLDRYKLSLFINYINLPELPEILPDPVAGDVFYEEMSQANEGGINLFFANGTEKRSGQIYNSTSAGASPGPVIPSTRSAIVVSLANATGQDGRFDADSSNSNNTDSTEDSEVRLLAENLCHEILSYLGLKDTVVFNSNIVVDTDGLNSEKCANRTACEDSKGANGNIMFPYALPMSNSGSGQKYYPRDRLASQQVEIAQYNVGVE